MFDLLMSVMSCAGREVTNLHLILKALLSEEGEDTTLTLPLDEGDVSWC